MSAAAPTVFILAGPSGGHLFPAWAFAEELRLKRPGWRLCLVTGERARKLGSSLEEGPFHQVYYSPDFALSAHPGKLFKGLWDAAAAFAQAWRWLRREKPVLAAGFGSYIACPGILLASLFKVHILLHEQNQIAGKANRFLLPLAAVRAASFEETGPGGHRWTVTGLPIRAALLAEARAFERVFEKSCLTWLVMGGSQGSRRLNALVPETLALLSPEESRKIAVIHITGNQDFEKVTAAYGGLKIQAQTYPFFDKMHELFLRADFALTRAGANTLFELALFGVPAVAVPYPFAGAHQKDNALAFERRGALICREESRLDPEVLLRLLRLFLQDASLRMKLSQNIRALAKPDAGEKLAQAACAVAEAL